LPSSILRRDSLLAALTMGFQGFVVFHTTIRRMWAAFGLRPQRSQTFKLSSNPLFVDEVRDVIGLLHARV